MKNIAEILKEIGIEIPQESLAQFTELFKKNYKTIEDYNSQTEKIKKAESDTTALQEKLKEFEGVNPAELNNKIQALNEQIVAEKQTHEAERAKIERSYKTNEFLAEYKFVTPEVKEVFANRLNTALEDKLNEGKNRKDIFGTLILGEDGKARTDIFISETPTTPLTIPPSGGVSSPADKPGFEFNFTGVRTKN